MTSELLLAAGKSYLFVFAAILPILNPAATAPIFLSLTEGASPSTRALLARRIARNMFALMVGSMLVGTYVLEFFGISSRHAGDVSTTCKTFRDFAPCSISCANH